MKARHIVHVSEVTGIEPAVKQNEKGEWVPKKQRDGSPVFTLQVKVRETQRIGLKEKPIEVPDKLDSAIEVKVGSKNLFFECEQYVMAPSRPGGKPGIFYRAIKIIDSLE